MKLSAVSFFLEHARAKTLQVKFRTRTRSHPQI